MNIKIIAHTHWDREWYFSHFKSRVYAMHDFDEIIEFLEENIDFSSFLLDGQTSIVEEYLEFHPHMRQRLEKLIQKRRILIGPWYSQTDTLVISGENIIRNLLYGINYANDLGYSMQIGYLPDSFGMCEQMPQIYNGFDIKYSMFRRGIADIITKDREFYWESPDGSKVFVHNIYHYGSMAYPPEDKEELRAFIKEKIGLLKDSSTTGTILLFNGEDQKPIRKNLLKIIDSMDNMVDDIRVELADAQEAIKELENSDTKFITYKGEFTYAQHSRTHKSIFSTRADLKMMNNYLENYLTNIFEPILSISHILGENYEKESVDYIWKKMLDNAAHDSIGMCNSDITNRFIKARYEEIEEFSKNLIELKLRLISNKLKQYNIFQFQVYNLLPYKRKGTLKTTLYLPSPNIFITDDNGKKYEYVISSIEDVTEKIFKLSVRETGVAGNIKPRWLEETKKIYLADITIKMEDMIGFGYDTLYINEEMDIQNNTKDMVKDERIIKNEFLEISINAENQIDLFDKRINKYYKNFIQIQDDGDEGDSYDYSQPTKNVLLSELTDLKSKVIVDNMQEILEIDCKMKTPYDLLSREKNDFNSFADIKINIILKNDDDLIEIETDYLNKDIEKRVRLVINTDIKSEYSVADEQFGTIKRPVVLDTTNWKEDGWNEKPRTIEPCMSYCALRNDKKTIQVITDCVREYQIIGQEYSNIAFTVFRSTVKLGKENLNDRPGRESGNKSKTFDTRFINKSIRATHYVKIYNYEASDYEMAKLSKEIFTPFISYQGAEFKNNTEHLVLNDCINKDYPKKQCLFSTESEVVLSCVKKSEKDDSLIIRMYNPSMQDKKKVNIELKEHLKNKKIEKVKLNEQSVIYDNEDLQTCQMITLKIH